MEATKLWNDVWAALKHHIRKSKGDTDSQSVLNRQVKKFLGKDAGPVTPANSDIAAATPSVDELQRVITKETTRKRPCSTPLPIVLLELNGKRYAMYGNTRLRIWREQGGTEPLRAIIIKPRSAD